MGARSIEKILKDLIAWAINKDRKEPVAAFTLVVTPDGQAHLNWIAAQTMSRDQILETFKLARLLAVEQALKFGENRRKGDPMKRLSFSPCPQYIRYDRESGKRHIVETFKVIGFIITRYQQTLILKGENGIEHRDDDGAYIELTVDDIPSSIRERIEQF